MILSSSTLVGDEVRNTAGDDLGKIEDLMINVTTGEVSYAVLSFGGFLNMGNKLFAVPMQVMKLDTENKCFVLDETKERLENAPGFDKDNWPNSANDSWSKVVHAYYRR